MNTSLNIPGQRGAAAKQVQLSLHSLWIGLAALGCAYLMEANQVDYTYPLEMLLKGVTADNSIIEDHLYKIKL